MTSFRYLRSLSQIYCLRIDFAFCLGFYTRTLLAKLCSVFKVLPPPGAWRTGQLFNFIKPSSSCQELFWICSRRPGFSSLPSAWRHLNMLPACRPFCKYFFRFLEFFFALVFYSSPAASLEATLLIYPIFSPLASPPLRSPSLRNARQRCNYFKILSLVFTLFLSWWILF